MSALISFILATKMLWPVVGCLIAAGIVYFKGRDSGLESARQKNAEAMDRIEADLRKREAQNQNTETQRDKDAETVRDANSIPMLISLFNKLFNQKAPGSDSDKKTP